MSKLFQILESHLPYAHAFADDNQLYVSFQPDSMSEQLSAVTVMENWIDDIKTWMLMINSNLTTVRLIFYYWYTKIARKSQF
jgi:hypothetical protein